MHIIQTFLLTYFKIAFSLTFCTKVLSQTISILIKMNFYLFFFSITTPANTVQTHTERKQKQRSSTSISDGLHVPTWRIFFIICIHEECKALSQQWYKYIQQRGTRGHHFVVGGCCPLHLGSQKRPKISASAVAPCTTTITLTVVVTACFVGSRPSEAENDRWYDQLHVIDIPFPTTTTPTASFVRLCMYDHPAASSLEDVLIVSVA